VPGFKGLFETQSGLARTVDLERYEKGNPRDFTFLKRSTLSALKKGILFQTRWGNVMENKE